MKTSETKFSIPVVYWLILFCALQSLLLLIFMFIKSPKKTEEDCCPIKALEENINDLYEKTKNMDKANEQISNVVSEVLETLPKFVCTEDLISALNIQKLKRLIDNINAGVKVMQRYNEYAKVISAAAILKWGYSRIPLNPETAYSIIRTLVPKLSDKHLDYLNFETRIAQRPQILQALLAEGKNRWLTQRNRSFASPNNTHLSVNQGLMGSIMEWFKNIDHDTEFNTFLSSHNDLFNFTLEGNNGNSVGRIQTNYASLFNGINRANPLEPLLDYQLRVLTEVEKRIVDFMDLVLSIETGFEIMGVSIEQEVPQVPKETIVPVSLRLPSTT